MKFNKEEIQKIGLMALLLVGLLYVYFNLLLGGISSSEAKLRASIAELNPKIVAARKQIKRTTDLEGEANSVTETLDQIKALVPEGAPIAWFPPKIGDYFKRQGLAKVSVTLNGEAGDTELEGFRRMTWTISIPEVAYAKLGIAVAGLENETPLLEIYKMQVGSGGDPLTQSAVFNIVTIVRK